MNIGHTGIKDIVMIPQTLGFGELKRQYVGKIKCNIL